MKEKEEGKRAKRKKRKEKLNPIKITRMFEIHYML